MTSEAITGTAGRRLTFLLFPASQLIMAVVSLAWIIELSLPSIYLCIVGFMVLACIPVDYQLFREIEKTQAADVLNERIRMLEAQESIQASYRERIEADMASIADLRKRAAREIDRAADQLAAHEEAAAREGLSRAVELMGTTAYRLCDHRSVDAVATMKLKACEDAGVLPEFALEVPSDVPIPAVELCAVIANLADNGLAAAVRAKEAGNDATRLKLTARVVRGHMIIEARNSLSPEDERECEKRIGEKSEKRLRSWDELHGWGLSIIEGIAQRHQGSLSRSMEDGEFCASIVLRLGENRASSGLQTCEGEPVWLDGIEAVCPAG